MEQDLFINDEPPEDKDWKNKKNWQLCLADMGVRVEEHKCFPFSQFQALFSSLLMKLVDKEIEKNVILCNYYKVVGFIKSLEEQLDILKEELVKHYRSSEEELALNEFKQIELSHRADLTGEVKKHLVKCTTDALKLSSDVLRWQIAEDREALSSGSTVGTMEYAWKEYYHPMTISQFTLNVLGLLVKDLRNLIYWMVPRVFRIFTLVSRNRRKYHVGD